MKKRILFFMIHPAYFHVFKNTINRFKSKENFEVDILITSKDVLEDLVKKEGWSYLNIFPQGRKIKSLNVYLSAFINFFVTIFRIEKFLKNKKKYDLFITDDLLCVNGYFRKIPTFVFQDDDLSVVPETFIQLIFSKYIFSPNCTNLGIFNRRKVGYNGYKELAYLHPENLNLNFKINQRVKNIGNYILIRLVSLNATHDFNKTGLTDKDVIRIINKVRPYAKIFISSEGNLSNHLKKYELKISSHNLVYYLKNAKILISDSQTMSSEAAMLGTPYIRVNDFVGKISYLNEIENKYLLGYGVKTSKKNNIYKLIDSMLKNNFYENEIIIKRDKMLKEKINLSEFISKKILETVKK